MPWSINDYIQCIQNKKEEAHKKQWLYIDSSVNGLGKECEVGAHNEQTCYEAMLEAMLEGDVFIVKPKRKQDGYTTLVIRYYVDHLSPQRKAYKDVEKVCDEETIYE